MKTWDVIAIGGGVIGLSLAWEVRKRGASVLVVERGELGGEASSAAGGMLAWCDPHLPAAAHGLAALSAKVYGEFVREIEDASGVRVDLRKFGSVVVDEGAPALFAEECRTLGAAELAEMEPGLRVGSRKTQWWPEWSVDPRRLMAGLSAACRARGVEVLTGVEVSEVLVEQGRAGGVVIPDGKISGGAVVNCAGAWAAEVACGLEVSPSPMRPVKGQILAMDGGGILRCVMRAPEIYLIPRSDGSVVVGATVEEVGFDKVVRLEAVDKLRRLALELVPGLEGLKESWAGLRPATVDGLPVLGESSLPGYFVAGGHFRDGVLLAPATAKVMSGLIFGEDGGFEELSPKRFGVGEAVA